MENETNEPGTTEQTTTEPEVKMIPETRLNNLATQINEKNAEIDELRAFKAQVQAETQAQADAEALARGEHEKVIAAKDEVIKAAQAEIKQKDDDAFRAKLSEALSDAGAKDKYTRNGMIGEYLAKGETDRATVEDWLTSMVEASPSSFEEPATPVKTGSVGSVKNENGSLDARLNSTDAKVRMAALGEQLSGTLKGSL